jgi:hypothetical protein
MGVRITRLAVAVGGLVLSLSCGGVVDPSKNRTENFSGTLDLRGQRFFTVNIENGGEFSGKITALQPTPTAIVGLVWGQGPNCEIPLQNTTAILNSPAIGGAIFQKGAYCVGIYDVGTLTVAQTFTISVSHP